MPKRAAGPKPGRADRSGSPPRARAPGEGGAGRAWDTSTGNLAATLLVTTDKSAAEAAQLSFIAAFAIRDLARAYVPDSLIRFKWPNDVMVAGEKLSGILIESGRAFDRLWLAVGMGINLAHSPQRTSSGPPPRSPHTSRQGSPPRPSRPRR